MKRAKILVTLVTVICMAVTMFPAYTFAEEATTENVIEIGTAAQLQEAAIEAFNNGVPKGTTYRLTADIDFSGFSYAWDTGAVHFGTTAKPFCGTFDGNGHVIKNLKVGHKSGDSSHGGLFGGLGDGAVIKNLGMENTTVNNQETGRGLAVVAGTVAGNVTITDCYIRDTTYSYISGSGRMTAGFVVAVLAGATLNITNCYVTGTKSAIQNCQFRGEMFAWSQTSSTITKTINLTNCYTDTNQLAPKPSTTSTTVANVTNCYANSQGAYNADNKYGTGEWLGTAVAPDELKSKATTLGTGFKENPSSSVNGGYPLLAWEPEPEADDPVESNAQNPTIISTKEDLAAISKLGSTEGQYFKLANDIDLVGAVWTDIIGTESNKFAGVFDGCGHVIRNFKISIGTSNSKYYGLFGYVGKSAHILNLGVENVTGDLAVVEYGDYFGGIAGVISDRAGITGCYAKNVSTIRSAASAEIGFAGGIVGLVMPDATAVEIRDCYSRGFSFVEGSVNWKAGLIGLILCTTNGATVENCYSDTTLTGIRKDRYGTVNNSYCMDSVKRDEVNSSGTVVDEDTLKNKVDSLGSKKFVSGDDGYPVLKWTKSPGMYINLVPNGSITNENYLFDNATAEIIDGRTIENDKQAHKLQTPYCNRNSKVIKANEITIPVTLEKGKYYRIAFSGLADLPEYLANIDFSFKIGEDNIYDSLADKKLYYYSWREQSVVYTPSESGTYNLFISCGVNMYVDDITVEVLDGNLESSIAAGKLTLKYLAVDVVDNDIYLESKTADGIDITYSSKNGYIDNNGKLTDKIPVGSGTVDEVYTATITVAGVEASKNFNLVIQKREPYRISGVRFLDENGNRVYSIEKANKIASIYVEKNTEEKGSLIAAFYKGDVLCNVKTVPVENSGEIDVNLNKTDADKVKLFVFGDDAITPLANPKTAYEALANDASVKIYTAGDSICSTYTSGTLRGWGQMIGSAFAENVVVDNSYAVAGMTAAVYAATKLESVLGELQPNDYLLIQLAHNDKDTYSVDVYKALLEQFVVGARQKGAIPVFVTSPESLTAATDTKAEGSDVYEVNSMLNGYPEAMKELAAIHCVPVVDLNAHIRELMAEKGKTELTNMGYYATEVNDMTHFTEAGATYLADFIANEMNTLGLPVGKFINK